MKSIENIASQLCEQLSMLVDYCELYDAGRRTHAKSICVRLSTIFKDILQTPQGGKLIKDRGINFASIRAINGLATDPGYFRAYTCSAAVLGVATDNARFLPYCSADRTETSVLRFGKWWHEPVLLYSNNKKKITRGEIINQMRNRDGGGHGYEALLEPYFEAALNNAGWSANGSASVQDTSLGLHFAIMRHIAHETLVSLIPKLTDYSLFTYDLLYSGLDNSFSYLLPPHLLESGSQAIEDLSITLSDRGASTTYIFDRNRAAIYRS